MTKIQQANYLAIMPNEMTDHIFSYMDMTTLKEARLVCRIFSRIGSQPKYWKDMVAKVNKVNDIITKIGEFPYSGIVKYTLSKESDNIDDKIIQLQNNIRIDLYMRMCKKITDVSALGGFALFEYEWLFPSYRCECFRGFALFVYEMLSPDYRCECFRWVAHSEYGRLHQNY